LLKPSEPTATRRGPALLAGAGLLLGGVAAVGLAQRLDLSTGASVALAAAGLACWLLAIRSASQPLDAADAAASIGPTAETTPPAPAANAAPRITAPWIAADWERTLLAGLPGRSFVVQPVSEGALTDWLVLASHDTDTPPAAVATPPAPAAAPELLSHWLARHPQHRPAEVVQALQGFVAPTLATTATPSPARWRALPLPDGHRLLWQPGSLAIPAAPALMAAPAPPAPRPAPPALNDRESIAYTVSHDLRAPIRVIEGFTRIVREDYGHLLDRIGNDHLDRVLGAATRMNGMIDALLALSKLSTQPLVREAVSLSDLAAQIVEELRAQAPLRMVQMAIAPDLIAHGDPGQLRTALENLLGNAWKYTARRPEARIEFGATRLSRLKPDVAPADDRTVYTVRDNGAGFDPRFAERLFGAFQRLHSASEFAGTGVGLASVRRIVVRHGGEIWADAAVDQGACFYFTLGER
jgi:signal transduction histidine kinase